MCVAYERERECAVWDVEGRKVAVRGCVWVWVWVGMGGGGGEWVGWGLGVCRVRLTVCSRSTITCSQLPRTFASFLTHPLNTATPSTLDWTRVA